MIIQGGSLMYRQDTETSETAAIENVRKLKTRIGLIRAVTELLGEMPAEDIAMHHVADRADINITTAYKHFTPKPTLFLAVAEPMCDWFSSSVAEHIGRTPFFEFVRMIYSQAAGTHKNEPPERVVMLQALAEDIHLVGALRKLVLCQVHELTRYAAHDFGLDSKTDPRPYLAATLLVGAHMDDFHGWAADPVNFDFVAQTRNSIDAAEKLLIEGLQGVLAAGSANSRKSAG